MERRSGHFDSVENISMHDTAARQNALMNGDVHVIDQVAPKTAHLLERAPTVNLLETTGTFTLYLSNEM